MLRTEVQSRLGKARLLKVVLEFVIIMYSSAPPERLYAKAEPLQKFRLQHQKNLQHLSDHPMWSSSHCG
jgi:hypothetical protein